jgi:hypothetical protein
MALQAHFINEATIGFSGGAVAAECHRETQDLIRSIGYAAVVREDTGVEPPEGSISAAHLDISPVTPAVQELVTAWLAASNVVVDSVYHARVPAAA